MIDSKGSNSWQLQSLRGAFQYYLESQKLKLIPEIQLDHFVVEPFPSRHAIGHPLKPTYPGVRSRDIAYTLNDPREGSDKIFRGLKQ